MDAIELLTEIMGKRAWRIFSGHGVIGGIPSVLMTGLKSCRPSTFVLEEKSMKWRLLTDLVDTRQQLDKRKPQEYNGFMADFPKNQRRKKPPKVWRI